LNLELLAFNFDFPLPQLLETRELEECRLAMRLQLLMIGKTRRKEMRAILDDYINRIRHWCPLDTVEVRDGRAALKKLDADRAATTVLLDAGGRTIDSNALAKWLGDLRDRGARQVIFVCGDAGGFPESLRQRVSEKLSLSTMTLSHELARVVLAEQLYRAFAILAGSPYPK
jgi:23S rRNA (pseudouridine1915-N3)-methyltransferase